MAVSPERKREMLREGINSQEEKKFGLETDLETNRELLKEVTDETAEAVQSAIEKLETQLKACNVSLRTMKAKLQALAPQRSGSGRTQRRATKRAAGKPKK